MTDPRPLPPSLPSFPPPSSSPSSRLSRRGLLTAGGVLGLGALLTACGSGDGGTEGSASGRDSGAWSFKDDRGETARADRTPKKIVAFTGSAAALHDYGVECTGVFGPTKLADGRPDPQAGDIDVDKVTVLGNAWGEFNIEKYAALGPELLVTNMYEQDALWYVPDESRDKILSLAPSVGLMVARTSLNDVLDRYTGLAASLGADLKAKKVTDARKRFEEASERLRRAARDKRGLKVLAASAAADLLYASDPAAYADLTYFRELGVELITPDKIEGGFFENLSWENADKYRADLILLDNRSSALQPEDLADKPTWPRLPAVRADQVVPWTYEPRFSHAGCAPFIESLAEALEGARKAR